MPQMIIITASEPCILARASHDFQQTTAFAVQINFCKCGERRSLVPWIEANGQLGFTSRLLYSPSIYSWVHKLLLYYVVRIDENGKLENVFISGYIVLY